MIPCRQHTARTYKSQLGGRDIILLTTNSNLKRLLLLTLSYMRLMSARDTFFFLESRMMACSNSCWKYTLSYNVRSTTLSVASFKAVRVAMDRQHQAERGSGELLEHVSEIHKHLL